VIAPAQVRTIIQACQFGLILITRCAIAANIPPALGASLILDLSGASDSPLITCVAVGILIKKIHEARSNAYISLGSALILIVSAWATPKTAADVE